MKSATAFFLGAAFCALLLATLLYGTDSDAPYWPCGVVCTVTAALAFFCWVWFRLDLEIVRKDADK